MTNNDRALAALDQVLAWADVGLATVEHGKTIPDINELGMVLRQALTPQSSADTPTPNTPSAEALQKAIIEWAFLECQPNKGDIFSWLDDNKTSLANHLAALTAPIEKVDGLAEAVDKAENDYCWTLLSNDDLETLVKAARLQLQRQGD